MLAIAGSELRQVLRNRAVLLTSFLMPVAVSAFFIQFRDVFAALGSPGYIAAIIVVTITAFTLYAATVTTVAARRRSLFLKRLRSTAAGDPAILAGLVLPVTAISLLQMTVVLAVFAAISGGPASVALLTAAVASTSAMMLAFGAATAGVTQSPEHAQVTTLPLSLGVIAVASWVGITGADNLATLKRLLPGGAATEMILNAWDGGVPATESMLLLVPTLVWAAVAAVVASKLFRWEPRQ